LDILNELISDFQWLEGNHSRKSITIIRESHIELHENITRENVVNADVSNIQKYI